MDVTADAPPRSTLRRAMATLGGLSALGLAGCAESDPEQRDPSADPTDSNGGDRENDPGADDDPTTTDDPAADGLDDADCDAARIESLYDELDDLDEQLIDLEFELADLERSDRGTELLLDQLEAGFPTSTIERARAIGLDVRESVVALEILDDGMPSGHATGWVVDDGHLLTNAHNVYAGGVTNDVTVVTHDGDRFDADVVDFVETMQPDVALLRVDGLDAPPLSMTSVDDLEAGQPLVQVGHPGEVGFWIISLGRFVDARRTVSFDDETYSELTTVVPGRQGVSGSPLLTLDGDVVGMTHGGSPIEFRKPGDPAPIAPDLVFDAPIAAIALSLHSGSDALELKLEDWQ